MRLDGAGGPLTDQLLDELDCVVGVAENTHRQVWGWCPQVGLVCDSHLCELSSDAHLCNPAQRWFRSWKQRKQTREAALERQRLAERARQATEEAARKLLEQQRHAVALKLRRAMLDCLMCLKAQQEYARTRRRLMGRRRAQVRGSGLPFKFGA